MKNPLPPPEPRAGTQIVRRTLFDGELLRIGHVTARPSPSDRGGVECQDSSIVVLPLAGVFAKHDGPRRHVIGTPNHAVFIAAGSPYRLSYPADIGDRALTLWFSAAALARVMPEAMARDGFDSSAFESSVLLPPGAMLARSLLWQRLERGERDPLEVEEAAIGLLACSLHAARKSPHRRNRRAHRESSGRRLRQVERVKEAISLEPGRKWTLAELAGLAHVSPFHLAHVFREEAGASVYAYVVRSRLASALDAVIEAGTDLSAIAHGSGFSSHSHFTARFRALFGLTPLDLRRGASRAKAAEMHKIVTAQLPAVA